MTATFLTRVPSHRRAAISVAVAAGGILLALAMLFGRGGQSLDARRIATPVPLPVYEIEAVSGGHQARLLNLPLPYVGAPQVPVPVDINGDLLPDVTVSVNLINAQGIFNNPPNTGELIAPNIEINRLVTGPILNPLQTHDLRINVKLTLVDAEGQEPNTVVRFGYDTGPGGAIPPKYKAVLGGLETGFNPLRARIDTAGGYLIGLDPRLPDAGLAPRSPAYMGPLTSYAAFESGEDRANLDLRFRPMPDLVEVSYENRDDGTQAFTYAHNELAEVDLDILGHIESEGTVADLDARVDRLPRQVGLDILSADNEGGVQYTSQSGTGRLPDLAADIVLDDPEFTRPLRAHIDAESLPNNLGGRWRLAPGEPPEVDFNGSGQGIGAIEARVQNYEGAPTDFEPWVPSERQHVSIQAGPEGVLIGDTLIQARLERLRGAFVHATEDGSIEGQVRIGDGERPLQIHGELDLRPDGAPYIEATATVAPLPDTIDFIVTPNTGRNGEPMRVRYEPSETVDVDTEAIVGLPGTEGRVACGDAGTVCANVQVRNVPTFIEARVHDLANEARIEVDAVPREGAAPLDVFANATLGPVDDVGAPFDQTLAAPVYAEVNVQGLPRFARFRLLENDSQDLHRVDVRTCDLDYDTNECEPGTDDEVAELDFAARNFALDERPADLPAPPQSGPLYVTVTARGLPDTNELVHYEATGRMTDFRQLTYLGIHDLTAVRADIGSGEDFRTWIDVEDVDLDGGDPDQGRIDLDGDIRISPLPTPLTFCIAQPGRPLTETPFDDITASCESPDPFGDRTATRGPLTIAYDAPTAFDVVSDIELRGDLPFDQSDLPLDFGTFDRIGTHVALTNIPGDFTAYVATPSESSFELPGDAEATGTRVRTVAPGASATRLDLGVELTTEGVDCEDPDPDGVGGVAGAVCADLLIDGLPNFASALLSTATTPGATDAELEQRFEAYGCDFEFFGATRECRAGTEGSIGVIQATARAHAGQPGGVATFVAPADAPHVFAQADLDDLANFEVEAGLRIEDLRAVTFVQDPDGTEFTANVGDGTEPLTVHGRADLRDADTVLEDDFLLDLRADLELDPLPDSFSFVQTGPGANQTAPMHIDIDSSDDVAMTASAEIRHVSSDGPDCGASATLCAEMVVDAIPAHIDADLIRTFGAVVGRERESSSELHIDLDPHAAGDPKPRIDVHAAAGVPADVPVVGSLPLFADLALVGIPLHTTIDLDNREVLMGSNEVRASNLERVQFHACDFDTEAEECVAGTEDRIDLIEASARTVDLRPTDFPAPPAPGPGVPPAYISLAGRGDALEAYARIPEISEVQFVNRDGVIAARARIGGSTAATPVDLGVNVDVLDLPIQEEIDLGDVTYTDPVLDARAALTISPFPGDLSFCLREGGIRPVPVPSGIDFAAACEDTDPFDTGSSLQETPLSIGFDAAGTSFDVDVDAELTIDGVDDNGDPLPTNRLVGRLALGDVPDELSFHFLQPRLTVVPNAGGFTLQPRGQYRARLDAPNATSGLDVSFAAEHLIGDGAQCEDPRPTVSATCVSAELSNLPTEVDFLYDPDLDLLNPDVDLGDLSGARNLFVFADGPDPSITIDSVHFSRVRPRLDDAGAPVTPLDSDVIVADIDLGDIQLPLDVRGTIFVPKGEGAQPIIDLENMTGNLLPEITVAVRSYIAPNPFVDYDTTYALTGGLPLRDVPNNGGPVHTLALLQRGDDFRLNATLPAVRRVSARAVLDEDREPLGTFAVDVAFAVGFNVRAFLDLQPDQTTRIYADARLDDIPAEMSLCFRGARLPDAIGEQPFPGTETWCDSSEVHPDEGAFEFAQEPNTGASTMDIDAFARLELGGGSTLISGRVDIDEIPQVMRARLPGEVLEVRGLRPQFGALGGPLIADGIDRINFQAATFDIDPTEAGYGAYAADTTLLPYTFRPLSGGPFPAAPAPADGREFLHVAGDVPAQMFHARGQLGRTDGFPSSQLQTLYYATLPCDEGPAATPELRDAARASLAENRSDYPHLPTTDGTTYTCVSGVFDPSSDGINPLSLRADVDVDPETTIRLREGGLDNIPQWFEVNIADAPPFQDMANERGWRRPCGPQTDAFANCMAPLLRLDQPDNAVLFGAAEVGRRTDLNALQSVDPSGPAPNFDAMPTATGWDGAFTDDRGARVRIIDFPDASPFAENGQPQDPYSETRQGISAVLRIPIPHSLTVDTPQEFANDDLLQRTERDKHIVGGTSADDMRFRVTARGAGGAILDPFVPGQNLGDAAIYLARQDRRTEMIVGRPCDLNTAVGEVLGAIPEAIAETLQTLFLAELCPEYRQGIPLPGEMGIALYQRNQYTDLGGDSLRTSSLMQVDGRLSHSVSVGVRARTADIPDLVAQAFDVPGGFGAAELADSGRPTFRLRAEMIDDADMPKDSEPEDNSGQHQGDEDEDIISFDMTSRFAVGSVMAQFDFQTPGNAPARRVDAVIYTNIGDVAVGVDIAAFSGIEQDAPPTEIDAYVSAQITEIFLEGFTSWNLPIDEIFDALGDIVTVIVDQFLGDDNWVSKALSWLISAIGDVIMEVVNGVLNLVPAGFVLDGRADVNLDINDLSRFTYRQALLHGYAESQGSGDADIGPINLYFSQLSAGLHLRVPEIPLPTALINDILDALECIFTLGFSCDDDEFVPESIGPFEVLLLGYGFHPTGYNLTPFVPLFLDFRDCDALAGFASVVPALGAGFDNAITVDGVEDFAIWPGTDLRLGLTGVAIIPLGLTAVITTLVLDFIVDILAGPILCHGFDNGEDTVLAIDYNADPNVYNPGNTAGQASTFAGHPVPGQPGAPLTLHESDDPSSEPSTEQTPPVPSSATPTPPAPPTPRPPLYSGTTGFVLGTPIAMCGVHEYDTLTVSADITVADAPNPTLVDGRTACAAGDEGTLELRANQLGVTADGSITADAIADDIPDLAPPGPNPEEDLFRATGSSGGTNAGTGFDGSAPSSAVGPFTIDRVEIDDTVTAGGPGSEIPPGYTDPDLTDPIASAGAAGRGGGAIVLRADTLLALDGPLSANGGSGSGDLTGDCDDDPDDNGVPGLQQHHVDDDADPDTPIDNDQDDDPDTLDEPVDNDVLDPTFEHTGVMGSGGGAGGGILLWARTEVDVLGDDLLSAAGGDGGDGRLGAGGGGGGGVVRVMAPIISGVGQSDVDDATVAGLNGATAPAGETTCEGVDDPAAPTFDNPDTPAVETDPLPTDGFGKVVSRPFAELEGYGPFWFRGGPQTPLADRVAFTGYLTAGGGPGPVDVVACAVRLPDDPLDADSPVAIAGQAAAALPQRTIEPGTGEVTIIGQLPSVDEPCGSRSGSDIVEMGRSSFTASVQPPGTESQISLGADQTGYYGLYTTAVRARTAGNDCLDPTDEVGGVTIDDGTDCVVEPLDGIEWVVGIDADAPDVSVNAPTAGQVVSIGQIDVDFDATDPQAGLFTDSAGNVQGECRVVPAGTDPDDVEFGGCVSGSPVGVPVPDGPKTLQVRVRDRAGNVSDVLSVNFFYDQDLPQATADFTGGVIGGGGWYTTAPGVLFDNYDSVSPPAEFPYAYQWDNGLEQTCGPVTDSDGDPDNAPYDVPCSVPASEVAVLSAGEHTLHYTAISQDGRRHANDNDPNTGTPMPTETLRLDNRPPLVEVLPVGRPDQTFGGEPWFSYRPFVVVSAIDQFSASGVASVEYRFGGPFGTYLPFDVTNPPVLPIGQTVACGRATDVAGITSAPVCTTIRADGEAPTFSFAPSHAPDGDNGWYVTPPSFTASGYVDQPVPGAVGADTGHFRTRFDNSGYIDCNAPSCTIPASSFPTGRHLAHASAVDRFDNRAGEISHEVFVDLEDPVVVPVIGPAQPDGFNGWWHSGPFLTLFGDDGDGSGIASLEYSLTGPGGPFVAWTEPVQIGAGPHVLCWRGTDVAGRTSTVDCQAFQVDLDDPTATITPSALPNGDGWYAAPLVATASSGDPVPGSGVSAAFDPDLNDLCDDLSPEANPTSPSGQCISVDGGPYVPLTGAVNIGEGDHVVRTFSVDVSGRRSAVAESVFRVDLSPPVVDLRLLPPDPAQNGWYRAEPRVVLRANDGQDGSGVVSLEYRVDGGPWQPYVEPFTLGEGVHTVEHRATDLVGSRSGSAVVQVDTTSPEIVATRANRLVWSRLLGPSTIRLQYTLSDNLSGTDRVFIVIFDVAGNPVRLIEDTTIGDGFVVWDGRQSTLTGLVPLGVYYYRAVAVDVAGNWAQSGESKPITIRLL
ncbi:MAG: OmpL47-type beta-barrel domain-containing protein [Acidimicrobiales bacterium]